MKLKKLALGVCLFFALPLFAQDFDLNWTDKNEYSNKEDGYINSFLGSNDEGIYVFMTSRDLKGGKKKALICYDKNSMKELGKAKLQGYKDVNNRDKFGDEYIYMKTVVAEDLIYVFWKKSTGKSSDIYVESYPVRLKKASKLMKVFSFSDSKLGKKGYVSTFIMNQPKFNNSIFIGAEYSQGEGQNIKVEYVLLDRELAELRNETITLPYAPIKNRNLGQYSTYEFGEDGNIYIKSKVVDFDEKEKGRKRYSSHIELSVIDMADGDLNTYSIESDKKNIFNIGLEVKNGKTRVYGFFCDLDKDQYGSRTHGIFSTVIDDATKSSSGMNFQYFDKGLLDELFGEESVDRKKSKALSKKKREKTDDANENTIDGDYVIEYSDVASNGDLMIFCTFLYNYTVTVCSTTSNGGQSCRDIPYCNKRNVTAFRINDDGEIVWAQNVKRNVTYKGWNIDDIKIVKKDENFYAIYGGGNIEDELEGMSKREKKKLAGKSTSFLYSVFTEDGDEPTTERYTIQKVVEGKPEAKYISPLGITPIDGKFYANSETMKTKVGATIGWCATGIICPPLPFFLLILRPEMFRKSTGYVGVLEPIE